MPALQQYGFELLVVQIFDVTGMPLAGLRTLLKALEEDWTIAVALNLQWLKVISLFQVAAVLPLSSTCHACQQLSYGQEDHV